MLTEEHLAEMRRVARGHNEGTDLSEAAAMAAAVVGHIDALTARAEKAERERDEVRKALKPFAHLWDNLVEVHVPSKMDQKFFGGLTYGDLREARRALAGGKGE